jgi:hypothetical protein
MNASKSESTLDRQYRPAKIRCSECTNRAGVFGPSFQNRKEWAMSLTGDDKSLRWGNIGRMEISDFAGYKILCS